MTSAECRDYLDHLQHFGIKLGLENIAALCAALGNPQNRFLSIHVAGTNGKGSVSAMLAGIMRAHGLKTGLYTSPHLARIEERIRINGTMIPPRRFRERLTALKAVIDRAMAGGKLVYHPTYFEVVTALAFVEFAEREVDVAVLEVGHGRAVRRHQRRPAPRLGHHHDRQGPREAPRRDARQDRLRESGHRQAGRSRSCAG